MSVRALLFLLKGTLRVGKNSERRKILLYCNLDMSVKIIFRKILILNLKEVKSGNIE